jgi:hypothetical protein
LTSSFQVASRSGNPPPPPGGTYEHSGDDILESIRVEAITAAGMKIDRMFFDRSEDAVRDNDTIAKAVEAGQWDHVIDYVNREVFESDDRICEAVPPASLDAPQAPDFVEEIRGIFFSACLTADHEYPSPMTGS